MFCSFCTTENLPGAKRCVRCGNRLIDELPDPAPLSSYPLIWSPDAAAGLSLLLTPVFGAVIHALNWRRLGRDRLALLSWLWAALIILTTAGAYADGLLRAHSDAVAEHHFRIALLANMAVWYVAFGRLQSKYVVSKLESRYIPEAWKGPVCIAAALLAMVALPAYYFFG